MIMRIIWFALLAVIGVVAIYAQMDRAARFAPDVSASVAAPFRGFAQQKLTESAILAGDAERSLPLARALVRVRPAPAEHFALLARAQLLAGDEEAALAALQAAGSRGWREPTSQQAMAEAALVTDNYQVAAQRISALMATGRLDPAITTGLIQRLAQTADGREAFAEVLAAEGYWQANFAGQASALLPPDQFADLMARAARMGAAISCDDLERAAAAFAEQGDGALVAQFWPGNCPAQ